MYFCIFISCRYIDLCKLIRLDNYYNSVFFIIMMKLWLNYLYIFGIMSNTSFMLFTEYTACIWNVLHVIQLFCSENVCK